MLFHVSEEPGIERFEPRLSPYADGPVVWAIDADRLRNYLLPRECPRVTYYAGRATTATDVERFLGLSPAVIAVESAWLERLRSCRLYCYHMPPETFECIDDCAGYFVSREAVASESVQVVDDLLAALLGRGVEVRFVPNLWSLRDAVVSSTLRFSLIRMRNALPRGSPKEPIQHQRASRSAEPWGSVGSVDGSRGCQESHVAAVIPEFGKPAFGAAYMLRPGSYAVIFNDDGDMVVVSTTLGFALPGGGQNHGESPEDAAAREVEEECGLRVILGARIGVADEFGFRRGGAQRRARAKSMQAALRLFKAPLGPPEYDVGN